MIIPAQHKDAFTRQFVAELLSGGEPYGHRIEEILDTDAFPSIKKSVTELAAASDPVSFVVASTHIRTCIEESAATLAAGVFDVIQENHRNLFVEAQINGHPQPHLAN